jgi:4'-phosphopantetheinyl transferase
MQGTPRDPFVPLAGPAPETRWQGWSLSRGTIAVAPETVGVWKVNLAQPEAVTEKLSATLAEEELIRARRFVHDRHRRRFVVARGALREVVAAHLGSSAASLVFEYNANGKPALAAELHAAAVHFNLAHAGEVGVIALTQAGPVGVDVEAAGPDIAWEDIARRFFAAEELGRILALPQDDRSAAFCRCWTRKEAIVKAAGSSIFHSLRSFWVDPLPWPEWHLVDALIEGVRGPWHVRDLDAGSGLAASLAVSARPEQVLTFCWVPGF